MFYAANSVPLYGILGCKRGGFLIPRLALATSARSWMHITPEMARDVLKNALPNRPISKARVRALIDDLRSGRWQINGESIVLDSNPGGFSMVSTG